MNHSIHKWGAIALPLILLLFSCTNPSDKGIPVKEINLNKYLQEFCNSENKKTIDYLKHHKFKQIDLVISFYKNRNYQSVWVKDKQTTPIFKNAFAILRNSMSYGLDTILYATGFISNASAHISGREFSSSSNMNSIALEIVTTHSMISLLTHIKAGILPPDSSIYNINWAEDNNSLPKQLEQAIQIEDLSAAIDAVSPNNPHYRHIQQALDQYLRETKITNEKHPVPYYAKDSSGCKEGVRKMLVVHGYLKEVKPHKIIEEKKVIGALVKFQTDFGLRNRGQYDTLTIETVRNSTFDLYRKACITLQRIRWSNIKDKNYLLVNIPSFSLNMIEEGEVAFTHKIICGKPDHETPELKSRISHFNLFPDWNVPHKISTKELLPKIKANPKYLEIHNYEILNSKNEVVDASKINWKKFTEKNFPYRIRQSSGDANSLGIIKFYFNNKYGVYLHDTPEKRLFHPNYRAFSHGCMRIQNPFDFAKKILEFDKGMLHLSEKKLTEINQFEQQKKFDKYRKNQEVLPSVKEMNQDVINVKKSTFYIRRSLPIYVRYFTAFVDDKQHLNFYPDLYHKDESLIKTFNKTIKSNAPF